MSRQPKTPHANTGIENLDDSFSPEEIANTIAETENAQVDDIESIADEVLETSDEQDEQDEESTTREKWENPHSGYGKLFQSQPDCLAQPVMREDGSPPEEKDSKTFKIFVVKYRAYDNKEDTDPDNLRLVYVWARNTQNAINVVAERIFQFHAHQFGATRGRRKKFIPEGNVLKMAEFFKLSNNAAGTASFLENFPDYRYIFDGSDQPEFATPKKVLYLKK